MDRFSKSFLMFIAVALVPLSLLYAQTRQPGKPPFTLDQLNHVPISGTAYYQMSSALGQSHTIAAHTGRHGHVVDPMVLDTTDLSNDALPDIEPAVARVTATNGTAATIVVATNFADAQLHNPRNVAYSTAGSTQYLPLPSTDYTYSGDPALAWYVGGARPLYASGIASNNSSAPNGVFVWTTTTLGQSWSATPSTVVNSQTSSVFYDKPSIAVSNSGATAGYVYVAYTEVDAGTPTRIWVARSTDGGFTFDQHYVPTDAGGTCACGDVSMSQVMVEPNGIIDVLWADFGANHLRAARTSAAGDLSGSWTMVNNGPTGRFIASVSDTLNGGLRAVTVPTARFDAVAHEIVVVWHAREATTQFTDVFYDAYNVNTGSWFSQPVTVNDENPNCVDHTDQFMPALAMDANGNVLITYYSRQNNCADTVYDEYFSLRGATGNLLQGPTLASTFQTGPGLNGFIGDYQDVATNPLAGNLFTIFYAAWIGVPPGAQSLDVMLTRIQ
jgi:hypothetical protein